MYMYICMYVDIRNIPSHRPLHYLLTPMTTSIVAVVTDDGISMDLQ